MQQDRTNGSHSAGGAAQQESLDIAPRYAQPEPEQQMAQQPYEQQQQQYGSTVEQTTQQQQQQQQEGTTLQQPAAAQQQAASTQQWQYQPPPSNVVEIDEVQVTPIDDPFYDPNNPSSNFDRSNREREASTAAAFVDDTSTAGVLHPSTNAVAIDDVDFEGFAAPLLDEPEAGKARCWTFELSQAVRWRLCV